MRLFALALAALLPCLAAAPDVDKAKALGNPAAPLRLEVYSDYMCPHCKVFHDTLLPTLIRDYVNTGKAYLVSREHPLGVPSFPYSREAANYATAAARVGKYRSVVDALFRDQNSWSLSGKVWDTVASALTPAEQKKVQALAKDPDVLAEVQRDVDAALAANLTGTPGMMIIHGQKHQPWPSLDNYTFLSSYLNGLLKK
jgi:protein-disulfide isomerase